MTKHIVSFIKKNLIEIILLSFSLAFSLWLMFSTFSYKDGSMIIATKAWSDFGSHIPLIRSFSYGFNFFPIEYPLFPGEPIKYHFLFYLFVGIIEKLGMRIDYALNILSAVSFFLLMSSIYLLAKYIFKSKAVGILSVIFFLFNSSLSFIEFFKTHPLPSKTFTEIVSNNTFPSFGPYDGKIVSAFWNLNIYTNQRHLALPIAFLLLLMFYILKHSHKNRKANYLIILLWGALVGVLPYLHFGIFVMLYITIGTLFLFLPKARLSILFILFFGGVLALPRMLLLQNSASASNLELYIGYLASDKAFLNILYYWFMNLGLSFILIPLGFLLAPKDGKKLFIAILPLFIIGNFIKFSPEIAANHKFFTVFIVIGNMFSAFALLKIWRVQILGKIIVLPLFCLMILSGIIDFFPIKNDSYMTLPDYPKNPDVKWITENTPKNSVLLNSTYLYHPASLAGRKIFLGWPYFPWSLGYDTNTRGKIMKELLGSTDKRTACHLLKHNSIDYIDIKRVLPPDPNVPEISDLFYKDFVLMYFNPQENFSIYSVERSCSFL